jgi:hypothetical protein
MFWQVLVNIIGHIRFLTMTNEDFANSPAMSGILTQEESFAILMNISCRDKWPMPSQLSSSRQSRYTAPYNLNFGEHSPGNRSPVSSCGRRWYYKNAFHLTTKPFHVNHLFFSQCGNDSHAVVARSNLLPKTSRRRNIGAQYRNIGLRCGVDCRSQYLHTRNSHLVTSKVNWTWAIMSIFFNFII